MKQLRTVMFCLVCVAHFACVSSGTQSAGSETSNAEDATSTSIAASDTETSLATEAATDVLTNTSIVTSTATSTSSSQELENIGAISTSYTETSTSTATSATQTDSLSTVTVTSSATDTGTGIPYGFWGLNGYITSSGLASVRSNFSASVFQVAQEGTNYTVNTFLPLVQAAGMKVTLRLSGDHGYYTTSGNFDLAKWKARIDRWSGSGIQPYIDDGTVVGHMILDDIYTFSGTSPTAAELDEMALYSKSVLPGLLTYVRVDATDLPLPGLGVFQYLDAVDNQYTAFSDGPVVTYAQQEHDAAVAYGLQVIMGLNIVDGGDGSSGQQGSLSGKYAMTATEIENYGSVLLAQPDVIMFLNWEYDGADVWPDGTVGADYFNQPELQAALKALGEAAASY